MEVWRGTEQEACHCDRSRGRTKRGDGDARVEPSHELLEHENGTGNWRVEGSRKPRTRAGREQHSAVRPATTGNISDEIGDCRAHLHAWTFASKRQPRTDGQQSTNELHGYKSRGCRRQLPAEDGLDMGDTTSRSRGRKAANQPCRNRDRTSTTGGHQ